MAPATLQGNVWHRLVNGYHGKAVWQNRDAIWCERCGGMGLVAASTVLHRVGDSLDVFNAEDVGDFTCPACEGAGVKPEVRCEQRCLNGAVIIAGRPQFCPGCYGTGAKSLREQVGE